MFHDRAKALAALRLALPIERSFDIGLHIHLRNDALRRGGRNITRSRQRVVPLEDLWQPILGYVMPSVLQSQAVGILRIFANIAKTMGLTPQTPSTNWTPQVEWVSRGDVVHELSASLLIEQRALETHSGGPRELAPDVGELVPPKKGSAPFRFELRRVVGIDLRRFEAVNRMFDLAPHFGLAMLRLLVERDVVPADYPSELAGRQRTRIATRDTSLVVYAININAPDAESVADCRGSHRRLPHVRRREDRVARGEVRVPGVRGARGRAPRVIADSPTRRLAGLAAHSLALANSTTYSLAEHVLRTYSNCTSYSYLEVYSFSLFFVHRYSRISSPHSTCYSRIHSLEYTTRTHRFIESLTRSFLRSHLSAPRLL